MERVEIYDHCRVWAGRLPWLSFEFRASTVGTFLVYLFYNPTGIALNFRNVRVELSRTFLLFYHVFPWWNKDFISTYYTDCNPMLLSCLLLTNRRFSFTHLHVRHSMISIYFWWGMTMLDRSHIFLSFDYRHYVGVGKSWISNDTRTCRIKDN